MQSRMLHLHSQMFPIRMPKTLPAVKRESMYCVKRNEIAPTVEYLARTLWRLKIYHTCIQSVRGGEE